MIDIMDVIGSIHSGRMDEHKDRIYLALSARAKVLSARKESENLSTMSVGDRVRTTDRLSPKYLSRKPAKIIGFKGEKIRILFDSNVDTRWYMRVCNVPASCLELE